MGRGSIERDPTTDSSRSTGGFPWLLVYVAQLHEHTYIPDMPPSFAALL